MEEKKIRERKLEVISKLAKLTDVIHRETTELKPTYFVNEGRRSVSLIIKVYPAD